MPVFIDNAAHLLCHQRKTFKTIWLFKYAVTLLLHSPNFLVSGLFLTISFLLWPAIFCLFSVFFLTLGKIFLTFRKIARLYVLQINSQVVNILPFYFFVSTYICTKKSHCTFFNVFLLSHLRTNCNYQTFHT